MSKKVVLEEEQYVEALERIIERDFFPDLPTLRKQNQQLHNDGGDTELVRSTANDSVASTAPRGLHTRHRVLASVARSEGASWDLPTPVRLPVEYDVGNQSMRAAHKDASGDHETDPRKEHHDEEMALDRFVATHTSEDNAAFTELQEKSIGDHKRRYHWAYDDDESKGDAKLHLLTNGKWISKEQRQLVDHVLAPEGPKDERPSAPDTWPFRARNALLFVPDLETSKQVCKVDSDTSTLLLKNGDRNGTGESCALVKHDGRVSKVSARAKRETVYANSRFQAHSTTSHDTDTGGAPSSKHELALVQMTPQIAPGIDASPLMTWGDIEGTPMILDARPNPDQILNGPRFAVKESSAREKVASRLEAQSRLRKSQARQQTPTPLMTRGKRPVELPTPSRAESIRSRLSSVRSAQRTPLFGSNLELRASYSTPLRPPRHFKSEVGKR